MNAERTTPLRLGLVGYGLGGHYFHAPFIEAAQGVELVGIVTRSSERRAQAAEFFPSVPFFESQTDLLASGVDAVVITTPPETRRELVLEAIAAGVHVIADKPFAPTAEVGRELVAAAAAQGVVLNVFHNRRWDTDIRTLQQVLASNKLTDVTKFESRFDLDEADTLDAGPTGGLLRDLGSHLVDQAIWLFGPPASVYCELDWIELPKGRTDSGFFIAIFHENGVRSHLSSSKINHLVSRELRLHARNGSYVSDQQDVQASAVFAGLRPAADPEAWGYEVEDRWGTLTSEVGSERIPSAQGAYQKYYEQFAAAVADKGPEPVPCAEGIYTLQVLDAARVSDAERRIVVIE